MEASRWKEFAAAVCTLVENSHRYAAYLEEKVVAMKEVHQSSTLVRSVHDGKSSILEFIAQAVVRKPNLIARYKALEEKLQSTQQYEAIFWMILSPSMHGFGMSIYLHEISLPFKIEVYTYHHGNNLGSL